MKKILLLLPVLLFLNLNAQTEFGIKAGYNLSKMKWDISGFDDYEFKSKSFFYAGALAEHHLSDKFSLQAELLYTELGGRSMAEEITDVVGNEVILVGTNATTFTTSQLQLPVSAKYYVAPNFSFSGGLNFGINVSSKVKNTFNSEITPNGKSNLFKTLNIFPFLGTEYQFDDHFFIDARYHFNFFNAAVDNAPPTKIGFVQAGLGYRFK